MRLSSLDALRGFIIVIMALDHVREYFSHDALLFSPEDLTKTNAAYFFTRWVTHICAPTFMLLAGMGAYLWRERGRTQVELTRYLITRGLWLILLELTLFRLLLFWHLGPAYPVYLLVLWALGASMIILGILSWLPIRYLLPLMFITLATHNLYTPPSAFQQFQWAGFTWFKVYPIHPWWAVMALGFCCGPWLKLPTADRRRNFLYAGLTATALFLILRAVNIYGDPTPHTGTLLSFLKVQKYPPSLLYLLMTLGPACLLLTFLERLTYSARNPLMVFGREPLFFFLGHFGLAHLLSKAVDLLRYGPQPFLLTPSPTVGGDRALWPADWGFSLPIVYLAWLTVLLLMYPLCVRFAQRYGKPRTAVVSATNTKQS
jgi:uncharacterized membrane protein